MKVHLASFVLVPFSLMHFVPIRFNVSHSEQTVYQNFSKLTVKGTDLDNQYRSFVNAVYDWLFCFFFVVGANTFEP